MKIAKITVNNRWSAANGTARPVRVRVLSSRVEVPFPRKGTETLLPSGIEVAVTVVEVLFPRKGTETRHLVSKPLRMCSLKYHFPVRGRDLVCVGDDL